MKLRENERIEERDGHKFLITEYPATDEHGATTTVACLNHDECSLAEKEGMTETLDA